jgi:Ca2+-binding RTX toxin-like protein
LSASATTAGSFIDNSANSTAASAVGMILKGTEGDNTIKGGAGADQITGGAGGDSLTGGEGADTIDAGTAGTDILVGGDGDDYLDLNTDLSKVDLISGGDDGETNGDTLAFSHKSTSTDILDRVSGVEIIKLENTKDDASITLSDVTVAAGKSLTVTTNNASFTGKLTFNASAEADGFVNITGGAGADTITGGALADTLAGGNGIDVLTGGAGVNVFNASSVLTAANADNVADFKAGAGGDAFHVFNSTTGVIADGTTLANFVTVAGIAALTNGDFVADTAANLGTNAALVGDQSATFSTAGGFALATDTGALYYDADGDFTAGAEIIATITATTATAGTFAPSNFVLGVA